MNTHRNARLGLAGRHELVKTCEAEGQRAAARRFGVSPATANKWFSRWQAARKADQRTLACLHDRASRPRRSPNQLAADEQARICKVREDTGWGPRLIAGVVGRPHSTVSRTLERGGCSRRPKPAREPANRYEWPCPGDLLHMDIKRYARFSVPGHAVTGDRSVVSRGAGWEYSHSVVDDHSRLAYAEVLDSQDAGAVLAFTERALAFFEAHGIVAKRLMTDNAWAYTRSRKLARLLRKKKIKHKLIRPRRPQTNGKVERFHQTMAREWGYGLLYASSEHRLRALPYWLDYYNEQRPHSALGGASPISRVHNLSGQDN
ncbi:MAG: family transposase [Actinomycetota bacterium]|jgi:transposase InsO family protein|nr:family transposase [Actinomycetota bacterium]